MDGFFPFLGTSLWVALVVFIFLRYGRLIEGIFVAIKKRIEAGDRFNANAFGVSVDLQPQSPNTQKEKIEQEVAEISLVASGGFPKLGSSPEVGDIAISGGVATSEVNPIANYSAENLRSKYLQAEDLALRELQDAFGVPLQRQMQVGDVGADGVFVLGNTMYLVEVKYAQRDVSPTIVARSVRRLLEIRTSLKWRRCIVLAVVFGDNDVDLKAARERIQSWLIEFGDKVDVRVYQLSALEKKYGLSPFA